MPNRDSEENLADQASLVVPADKRDEFEALLDRPARILPGLREAASESHRPRP
jgi:hypothetical protein